MRQQLCNPYFDKPDQAAKPCQQCGAQMFRSKTFPGAHYCRVCAGNLDGIAEDDTGWEGVQ